MSSDKPLKNLYCMIDTETTGLDRFKDEVIQVTIIPLIFNKEAESEFFSVDNSRHIFNQYIIPNVPINPDAAKVTGMSIEELKNRGAVSSRKSVEIFKQWFQTLNTKQILPMGHNWADFDKVFIMHWLSMHGEDFSNFFGYSNRDTLVLTHFLNDVHFLTGMRTYNPKLHFLAKDPRFLDKGIQERLRQHQSNAHNAFDDAVITIEVYNNFLLMMKNYYTLISLVSDTGAIMGELSEENESLKSRVAELEYAIGEAKKFIQQSTHDPA